MNPEHSPAGTSPASDDWRDARIARLRTLLTSAEPEIVEEIKWRKPSNPDGVPTFSLSGLICTVERYAQKVKVTFAQGAALPDPTGVFNASLTAGTRRAVDLAEHNTLDEDAFIALVRAAADRNRDR